MSTMPKPSKEDDDQFLLDFDPRYKDPRFRKKPGRELPPHPLAIEIQILIHYKNPRALEDWVCKELAVRAAKEVRRKIAAIKNPKAKKLHPRLLELVEMAERAGTPVPKKNSGRAESLLDYCNKELIVYAVDGIRISKEKEFEIKGFDVFIVVQDYLNSIGIEMSAQTIEKNYKKWKWGAYMVFYLAERRLHELSFKPLTELAKFVETRTGIKLFRNEEIYQVALLASAVRNLISHNDCTVNDVFRRKVAAISQKYEVSDTGRFKITDEWLRRTSYTLDGIVFDFDAVVAEKFKVSASFRLGKILLRS